MNESTPIESGLCDCGKQVARAGAERCPTCQAAHARTFIGRKAAQLKRLPAHASAFQEAYWVAENLHAPKPDILTAPSRAAVGLLESVKADSRLRRAFWSTFIKERFKRSY